MGVENDFVKFGISRDLVGMVPDEIKRVVQCWVPDKPWIGTSLIPNWPSSHAITDLVYVISFGLRDN